MLNKQKREKSPSERSDFNVITINGIKFVTGLEWINLSSPLHYMKEARVYGKKNNKAIVAIRKGKMIQAGFVPRESLARKGMYSLALALASVINDDFIGAFDLEDGSGRYLIVAVSKGEIIPLGDMVGDADFAQETLQQILNFYSSSSDGNSFNKFFAPASFDFADNELKLSDALTKQSVNNDAKLRQLHFGLSGSEFRSLLLLSVVVVGALYYWHNEKQKEEIRAREAERHRQIELARLQELTQQRELMESELEKPWVKQSSLKKTLSGCESSINDLPLSIGGWVWDSSRCQVTGEIEHRYRRSEFMTIENIKDSAKALSWPDPVIHLPGDGASFVVSWNAIPAGNDALLSKDNALSQLVSYFQRIGVEPELNEQVLPQRLDVNGEPLPPPEWTHYKFTISTGFSPAFLLSDIPFESGIRVDVISAGVDGDNNLMWNIQGSLYALH